MEQNEKNAEITYMEDKIDEKLKLHKNQKTPKEWKELEATYGKSFAKAIENPLQIHKKLIGVEKRLVKPKEPMVLMQKKDGLTEWFEGATQGVFEYEGSDGTAKKVWLSKKFLSTINWGNDTVRYYNCTEDSCIPNGTTNTLVEFEELEKIFVKQSLDLEKLKAKEWEARDNFMMTGAKSVALILLAFGALIAGTKMFAGIDILDHLFSNKEVIVQTTTTAVQNLTNTQMPPTALP